jgi:hypothetical protein
MGAGRELKGTKGGDGERGGGGERERGRGRGGEGEHFRTAFPESAQKVRLEHEIPRLLLAIFRRQHLVQVPRQESVEEKVQQQHSHDEAQVELAIGKRVPLDPYLRLLVQGDALNPEGERGGSQKAEILGRGDDGR